MSHGYKGFDFGSSLDDVIQAAREFGERMREKGPEMGCFFDECWGNGSHGRHERFASYFYPPTNVYSASDGSLVLEFALAGIDESAVSIAFQGDYLVLSAKAGRKDDGDEESRFSRRGFRPRDINRQKYRVSAEDYAQEQAKAVFKSGVLTVTVPPKVPEGQGIKIEIVKEGD
jgi:HSP20 family molecular chaperone IbpA